MSTIPLPALGLKQQEQPDVLSQVAKVRQIQALGQEQQLRGQQIQAGQLENQLRQRQLQDQQTTMQILGKHGGDLEASLPELASSVSAQTYIGLQKTALEMKKNAADLDNKALENNKLKSDAMLGLIGQAGQMPPDQYAQNWPQIAQRALEIDPKLQGQIDPAKPVPQQALAQYGTLFQTQSTTLAKEAAQRAQAEEERKAALAPSQLAKSQAEAQIAQGEAAAMQGGGVNPKIPIEVQEANSWLKRNPGKTLADYQKYKATLVPAFNFNLQNAGTSGNAGDVAKRFGMTPTAFDQAAERFATSGQLPPSGRGGPSLALNKAIMNRAGELHPEASLAANSAEYKANQGSLANVQKQFDQVTAFENTAGKNLDVFLNTAKKVVDSGSPWINKPLRAVASGALGSEDQAAFNAARTTAVTEIAKVLNSSNATGVLSDSARGEVQQLIGPNATLKQIVDAANILKTDMANRHQSYQDQIDAIRGRLGNKSQASPAANSPASGGAPPGATHTAMGSDGKRHYTNAQGQDLGIVQ